MQTILLISPYWREPHRWMVSSYKLAELWQRLGYRVIVVCMGSASQVQHVSETLTVHSRKDWFLPDPLNFGISVGFARYVRRVTENEHPDHIVVNKVLFWSSFSIIPLWLRGYRITLLTDALVGMTWWPRSWFPKLLAGIEAWTIGWMILLCANRIVFFHPQPARLLRRLGIAKKSRVIPTGIDPQPFGQKPETRNQSFDFAPSFACELRTGRQDRHRTEDDEYVSRSPNSEVRSPRVVVTYIGRLESVKGVDDFLAAAAPLKDRYAQLHVRVVGWYKANHPLVAAYQDRVEFMGLTKNVVPILAETDIFVLPSYSEGLSNAMMEAMASGCACIASDVGGNRFLLQNGISGLLFPAGDRRALCAHIERLINDPAKRRHLGEAARRRIDEMFSWNVVAKQYKQLFTS